MLFFLVPPCLVVAVQPCMEWIPIKKKENAFFPSHSSQEITPLKTEIVALKEFILGQLYDIKKSEEDLRSKSYQHASDKSPGNTSFKEKTD